MGPADLAVLGSAANSRDDLYLVDSATGSRQRIYDGDAKGLRVQYAAWSPDGSQLAFEVWGQGGYKAGSTTDRNVVPLQVALVDMATGKTRVVSDHTAVSDYALLWSPDGKHVAYLLDEGKQGQPPRLDVIDATTGSERFLPVGGFFEWLPDSTGVLAASGACGSCTSYAPMEKVLLDGGSTPFADSTMHDAGSDGPPITFLFTAHPPRPTSSDGKLTLVRREGPSNGPATLFADLASKKFFAITADQGWWLEGPSLLVENNGLQVIDTRTCAPRPAAASCAGTRALAGGPPLCHPMVSPDTKWVLTAACPTPTRPGQGTYGPSGWYLVPTDGSEVRTLMTIPNNNTDDDGVFMAASDRVVVGGKDSVLYLIDLNGQVIRTLGAGQALDPRPR